VRITVTVELPLAPCETVTVALDNWIARLLETGVELLLEDPPQPVRMKRSRKAGRRRRRDFTGGSPEKLE
jgi:hypothetical protein